MSGASDTGGFERVAPPADTGGFTRLASPMAPSAPTPGSQTSLFGRLTDEAVRDFTFGLSDQAAALGAATGAALPGSAHPGGFWATYEQRLNELRQQHADLESTWPGWLAAKAGEIGLGFASLGPEMVAAVPETLGRTVAKGAATGAGIGAAAGFGGSDITKHPLEETALGAAGGAALGSAAPAVSEAVKPLARGLKAYLPQRFPEAAGERAIARIAARQKQDEAAGGPTTAELRRTLQKTPGKPQAVLDVGGENIRGLAGHVGRTAGPSRTIVSNLYANRDLQAPDRIIEDIREHVSSGGSAYDARKALREMARTESDPLYKEALKPGSVAPLEHQFTMAFQDAARERAEAAAEVRAAQQRVTLAAAQKARAGNNVYSSSAALRAEREARAALETAQKRLADNTATLQQIREAMQEAQRAGAAGERGGVWSPLIGRLLKLPEMQNGIRKGIAIMRMRAARTGEPFNPSDYAITGEDDKGNPIISPVPNMRLLASAKKGLDDLLAAYRDKVTGILHLDEYGRELEDTRAALVAELGRLNTTYAEANAAFSEPMRLAEAIEKGQNFRSMRSEEIRDILAHPRADRDAFKLGVADRLIQDVKGTAKNADEAKKTLNNLLGEEQLQEVMRDDPGFEAFLKKIAAEKRMFESRTPVIGGSQTQGRAVEDAGPAGLVRPALRVGGGIAAAMHGEPIFGLQWAARGLRDARDILTGMNAREREEIARRLADPARALQTLDEIEAYSNPLSGATKALARIAPVGGGLAAGGAASDLSGY